MDKRRVLVAIREIFNPEKPDTYMVEIHAVNQKELPDYLIFKLEDETLHEAYRTIETVIKNRYDVINVHQIKEHQNLRTELVKKEVKKPEVSYATYEILVEDFDAYLDYWFEKTKGMKVVYHISYEGPDEIGYLGDIQFNIDTDKTEQGVLMEIGSRYGDIDYCFHNILKEMFESDELKYDFNIDTLELIVQIPIKQYLEIIKKDKIV